MSLNGGYTYREQLEPKAQGQTVLSYLSARHRHSSAEVWQARLQAGEVQLDGQPASGGERLQAGQWLVWQRPPWAEPATPQTYQVLHLDDALLAVNKPSGLPTLPGGGFLQHTLLWLVQQDYPHAAPLHRLGRATSGLVLFARSSKAARPMLQAWREHKVQKRYRALASGVVAQDRATITTPIGPVPHPRLGTIHAASPRGKPAHSVAQVLERRADSTLLQVDIQTGRPHQIRIHLASLGHPLVGDPLYGPGGLPLEQPGLPGDGGYLLHAERLRFRHPLSGAATDLHAPPPPALEATGP
ncbi:RluA family pseudouridine synthase [Deinococcus sonorensis]|uniref:Pseudouridine synthase n=2 Tax=Deinococcus sonorensis TaxID=309891 RepID=A0AAU7U7Q9_9DEIO